MREFARKMKGERGIIDDAKEKPQMMQLKDEERENEGKKERRKREKISNLWQLISK
jgi:hypothetical protein